VHDEQHIAITKNDSSVKKKISQSGASQKSNQDHSCLLFCPKKAKETWKKLVKSK